MLPLILTFRVLFESLREWMGHPLHGDRYRAYLSKYDSVLFFMSVISGSSFATIQLVNSNLRTYNQKRLVNVIVCENIPQLLIQTTYLVNSNSYALVVYFAMASPVLSVAAAVWDHYTQRQFLRVSKINTHTHVFHRLNTHIKIQHILYTFCFVVLCLCLWYWNIALNNVFDRFKKGSSKIARVLFSVKVTSKYIRKNRQNRRKFMHKQDSLRKMIGETFDLPTDAVEMLPYGKFSDSQHGMGLIVSFLIITNQYTSDELYDLMTQAVTPTISSPNASSSSPHHSAVGRTSNPLPSRARISVRKSQRNVHRTEGNCLFARAIYTAWSNHTRIRENIGPIEVFDFKWAWAYYT